MVGSLPVRVREGWIKCANPVVPVTVFEALMFAVTFVALIVSILSFNHKK